MQALPTNLAPKIQMLLWGIGLCMLIIIARLFHLQIYLNSFLCAQSQRNFLRIEKSYSLRGNIIDRHGNLLATNRPVTNLEWRGTGKRRLDPDQRETLHLLSTLLNTDFEHNSDIVNAIGAAERRYTTALLAADLTFEQLSKIKEQLSDHPNIQIETQFQRYYPHVATAAHILGYLGNIRLEAFGKMGLEKQFQEILQGKSGTIMTTTDSLGRKLHRQEIQQALAGQNVQVTIDLPMQTIAEQVFPADKAGALLVMNPDNGALYAVVSRPSFDPSLFLCPIAHDAWQEMQDNKPFINRAFNTCYPPGSIFKLVTTSAALESGIIDSENIITCRGFTTFAGRKYWCNKRSGHGEMTIMQALAHSCNPLFFEIGKKINIDQLADYAHRFGLGKKTDLLLPEKEGLIPSTSWKREHKGERWWPGETLSVAIGQSYLLVTPIQIARMIGSIFTGYLVTPRILCDEPIKKEPLALHADTREFLQQSMKQVVRSGTGQRINTIKDIEMYAKTSTAQMSDLSKRKLGDQYLEHGWFVTYFRYKNYEPLVIITIVEHIGSSKEAASTVKRFLLAYKRYMDKS